MQTDEDAKGNAERDLDAELIVTYAQWKGDGSFIFFQSYESHTNMKNGKEVHFAHNDHLFQEPKPKKATKQLKKKRNNSTTAR